jgi:hypothetical protein
MLALKTLGLSVEDGVRMGIITAEMAASAERFRNVSSDTGPTPMEVDAVVSKKAGKKTGPAVSLRNILADEALMDCVIGVVPFAHGELTRQSSDVAYILSDPVFYPLVRRLAAEILALEGGASKDDEKPWTKAWAEAPVDSDSAWSFADTRVYLLPEEDEGEDAWQRAMLTELSTDLMMVRLSVSRSFSEMSALAAPEDRVGDVVIAGVKQESGEAAEKIVSKIISAAGADASSGGSLAARLTAVVDVASAKAATHAATVAAQASTPGRQKDGPALKGGWSLMQEMDLREISLNLREEYTMRRRILLRRLDATIESICAGNACAGDGNGQRNVADCLARMWAGWRRRADKASPLSEYNALLATRSQLVRAITARVSAPSSTVKSSVKSVRIGAVPDRGGIVQSAKRKEPPQGATATASGAAPAQQARRARSTITETGPSSSGGAAASSSDTPAGAAAPASNSGPAELVAKPDEAKNCAAGARSTNTDLHQEHRKQERDPNKPKESYYEQMANLRGAPERT